MLTEEPSPLISNRLKVLKIRAMFLRMTWVVSFLMTSMSMR